MQSLHQALHYEVEMHVGEIHIEGCCGELFLNPYCLILAVVCPLWGINLAIHVSDEFARVLVVLNAAVHIRLL